MVRHCSLRWWSVFLVLLCGDFRSSLLCFSWWSFADDFLGISLGVTYEDLVPLWLVTLPPNLPWIGLDLVVFRVGRVLDLERRFLQFLLIESDSGRFLWGRGCPGGNPAIPEVSLQSVEWFGRSGDGKSRFWFRRIFLCEFVLLDQRSVRVKFRVVFVLFARSSCLEFFAGYRRLDRPW
jgi:hypothetical protein